MTPNRPTTRSPIVRAQRGAMLVVVLVCLTAMALVAAALYRSVDLATLGAGNLALATDNQNRSEMCVRRAVSWMADTTTSGLDLNGTGTQAAFNYFGVQFKPGDMDMRFGLPKKLVAGGSNGWMGTAPDIDAGDGTKVNCVIERLCTQPKAADATHCQMSGGALGGQGKDGTMAPTVGNYPAYRVSTRVDGVRGTSFSQVTLVPR